MSEPTKPQGEEKPEPEQLECPKCGHKFWHKLKDELKKDAGEVLNGVGNAIGEEKFGG